MKKGLWLILALALLWPCKAMALEAELDLTFTPMTVGVFLSNVKKIWNSLTNGYPNKWTGAEPTKMPAGCY